MTVSCILPFTEESTNLDPYLRVIYFFFVNRNVHGLVKTVWKLLQIQAVQRGREGDEAIQNLYGVRLVSHWFI